MATMVSHPSESNTSASSPQDYASPSVGSPGGAPIGKIAIPPKPAVMSSTTTGGPITKVWTIPPRPKPGRKPKEQTGDEARKEQNRQAQKKFRSKQNDKIQVLSDENEKLRDIIARVNAANTTLQAQLEGMRQQVVAYEAELLAERAKSKRQSEELEREVKRRKTVTRTNSGITSPRAGIGNSLNSISIPMSDQVVSLSSLPSGLGTDSSKSSAGPGESTPPYDDMEVDFTNYNRGQAVDVAGDGCGFCSSGGFCICAADAARAANSTDLLDTAPTPAKPPPSLPSTAAATGPGTCETCRRDPEQARKCQELAAAATYSPTPPAVHTSALGIKTGPDGLLADDVPDRVRGAGSSSTTTCSDFLAKFRPLDNRRYRDVFGKLHTYPHIEPVAGAGNGKAALDIDATEAAEALTSLAKNGSP